MTRRRSYGLLIVWATLVSAVHAQTTDSPTYTDFLSGDNSVRKAAFGRISALAPAEAQRMFVELSSASATLAEEPRRRALRALVAVAPRLKLLDADVCLDWARRSATDSGVAPDQAPIVFGAILPACEAPFSYILSTHTVHGDRFRQFVATLAPGLLSLNSIPISAAPLVGSVVKYASRDYGLHRQAMVLRTRMIPSDSIRGEPPSVRIDDWGCPASSALPTGSPDVEFGPRKPIYHVVRSSSDDEQETLASQAEFYDIGGFVRGKYEGARLVLATVHSSGAYKIACGGVCDIDDDTFQRYAVKGDTMTRLSSISDRVNDVIGTSFSEPLPLLLNMKAASDAAYTLPSLMTPVSLHVSGVCLTRYQNRPSMPSGAAKFGDREAFPSGVFRSGREFWISRPDGTAASYYFRPPKIIELGPYRDRYLCVRDLGKEGGTPLQEAYIPEADLFADNVKLTRSDELGDIYTVKTLSNPFVQGFRKEWIQSERDRNEGHLRNPPPSVPHMTDEQYLALHPVILWRDRFDEPFACVYQPFVNPFMAEPVVYLYPPTTQSVRIALAPAVHITSARPEMSSGAWSVVASPDGRISVGSNTYPYLFWEGRNKVILRPERGDVVSQADVPSYLDRALSERGLSPREGSDFKAYWLPKMRQAPYYLVAFYDEADMSFLAPLTIEPRPDTLIRVLMDFQPLDEKVTVQPSSPPRLVERRGFTVVEWGGLRR